MTATITRIHNIEHEARAVAAIRQRWADEARFERISWFRPRDEHGRFQRRGRA